MMELRSSPPALECEPGDILSRETKVSVKKSKKGAK
jgi:hypothetical protein